jgi:hypothetical protein
MPIKIFLILSIISTALFSQIKSGSYVLNLQNNAKDVLGFDTDAWLPDTMPVSIGNTIKIYNRNCYFEKNQRYGRVTPDWVTAGKGTEYSDGWQYTATTAETFRIYLYLYFNEICIDTATTVITTKAKQTINANFLKIGDSTTDFGFDHESDSLQSATLGTLTFIGTQTTNGVNHEGHGGYYYSTFSSTFPAAYSTNYPFNNNGSLDFNFYITHNSLANPDIVCFRVGINDCSSNVPAQTLTNIQANMEKLVDSLRSDFPNTLIIVSLTSISEGTGAAWLVNYDSWDSPNPATLNTWDNYQIKMRALWKITHDLYQGGRKDANIQISYEGLCLDRINMFKVNDTMHPKDAGYYQYGYILSNSLNYYKK